MASSFVDTVLSLNYRAERAIIVGCVATLHVLFALVLILGAAPVPINAPDISVALGGGSGGAQRVTRKLPDLVAPQDVQPPVIDIRTPSPVSNSTTTVSPGSPNVTRPTMALANAHMFPVLPPGSAHNTSIVVRLLLYVAEDGSIAAADVARSSGIAVLDRIAVDWVKEHWRYQPALRNGEAVAVTTLAVVTFREAQFDTAWRSERGSM